MNIVYNCNEAFAVHTAVSIVSLFENNRSADEISVYVLGNGLSPESAERFAGLAESYGRSLCVIDLRDYESALNILFGGRVDTGRFDMTVLARLFAPSHLPDSVARYIYLDADTVVPGSLGGLWQTELDGCICAMAAEPSIYADTRARLGLKDSEPYFNSGMILTDRIAWEREKITGACIDFYRSAGGKGLSFPDQDLLNYVLRSRIRPVSQTWNFFSNYHYRSYSSLVRQAPWYAELVTEAEYREARRAPAVVHFAGAERPWLKGNRNPYREAYHRYLELTPWKDTPDLPGREGEMLLYHIMNLATQICPPFRYAVSDAYCRLKLKKGASD